MRFEGCLHLPIEVFDDPVGYRVMRGRFTCLKPCKRANWVKSDDSNCRPRSIETVDGTPKREIQPVTNARAAVSAEMCGIGVCLRPARESIDARQDVTLAR